MREPTLFVDQLLATEKRATSSVVGGKIILCPQKFDLSCRDYFRFYRINRAWHSIAIKSPPPFSLYISKAE